MAPIWLAKSSPDGLASSFLRGFSFGLVWAPPMTVSSFLLCFPPPLIVVEGEAVPSSNAGNAAMRVLARFINCLISCCLFFLDVLLGVFFRFSREELIEGLLLLLFIIVFIVIVWALSFFLELVFSRRRRPNRRVKV